MSTAKKQRELTGRGVLIITVSAFAIIIAVNLTMAFFAVNSFPGLEVPNSYVASQGFNDRLARQRALGWQVEATLVDNQLRIQFADAAGDTPRVTDLTATLGRPTTERADFLPNLRFDGTSYTAQVDIDRGNWDLTLTATAEDGTDFRQRIGLIHR